MVGVNKGLLALPEKRPGTVETTGERLARVEESVEMMRHELFGNHSPGKIEDHEKRLTALEKFKYIGLGAIIVWGFLTGGGAVSLEKLLKMIAG